MTGTSSDQIVDGLDVRLRRGDRILLAVGWVLLAVGVIGVAVQVAMWPGTGGPVTAVVLRAAFIPMAVTLLVTVKRIRIMQEHIRWQREHIRTLTGQPR